MRRLSRQSPDSAGQRSLVTDCGGNLVKTCGTCHPNATANFVKYDPHADKNNRERNGALFFAAKGMQALLFATFGFFGLHTLLWLLRALKDRGTPAMEKPHA
jgi:hypothetical protein